MKTSLFLILSLLAVGSFASKDAVLHLTDSDFAEKTADGGVYFVKFFAPWCGHCKKLAPAWTELAEKLSDVKDVTIASIDCTVHKEACSKAEIKGYPTLKVYQGGEAKTQYAGARTLDDLKTYIEGQRKLLLEETTA